QMGLRDTSGGGVLIGSAGTVPSTGALTISRNSTATTAITNTGLQIVGADATNISADIDSFGTGAVPLYDCRAARGTAASPSAVQALDALCAFSAFGYGATEYSSGRRAQMSFLAIKNWTDAAQGAYVIWSTTTSGSVTM